MPILKEREKDPVEEAHILEEHIVAPAPAQKPVSPPPKPTVEAALQPEAPQAVRPQQASAGPESRFIPEAPVQQLVSIIPPSTTPSAPKSEETKGTIAQVGSNIANILKGIKLPERKTSTDAQPTPAKQYDTSLSDPHSTEKSDAARTAALKNADAAAQAITESLPNTAPKPQDDVRALHTLKDDLQHVVRDKKISLVRAVALEEQKKHRGTALEEHREIVVRHKKRVRFGYFFAGLLVFVGLIAIGSVLFIMHQRTSGIAVPIPAQVLFAEQSVPYSVDGKAPADVRREIAAARESGLTLGAILQIVPVKTVGASGEQSLMPLTTLEFLDALGTRAPAELPRALGGQFFFGLHTVDENAPLLVIPVTSYERAFAGMLQWEKTMNDDLSPIFTVVPKQKRDADGTIVERVFEDTVMRNYDVRALKDDSGTIQLYYSFPTRTILIIAESPYSFSEILSRLKADRKL